MATSDCYAKSNRKSGLSGRLVFSGGGGVVAGMAAYYLISIAATAPITGWSTVHPLILLMVGLVSVASVVASWKWPLIGVVAGAVVLALVVFVVAQRISWTSTDIGALSPTAIIGFGAASGYPTMIGYGVLGCAPAGLVANPMSAAHLAHGSRRLRTIVHWDAGQRWTP